MWTNRKVVITIYNRTWSKIEIKARFNHEKCPFFSLVPSLLSLCLSFFSVLPNRYDPVRWWFDFELDVKWPTTHHCLFKLRTNLKLYFESAHIIELNFSRWHRLSLPLAMDTIRPSASMTHVQSHGHNRMTACVCMNPSFPQTSWLQ